MPFTKNPDVNNNNRYNNIVEFYFRFSSYLYFYDAFKSMI